MPTVADLLDLLSPTTIRFGVGAGLSQLLLTGVFASPKLFPNGPWTSLPAFTAHQVVCLPLMVYLTYNGFRHWLGYDPSSYLDENDRVLGPGTTIEVDGTVVDEGQRMAQVALGMMIFWDVPAGFAFPSLRDTIMTLHHVGMLLVSGVMSGLTTSNGSPVGSYYSPFFFGVIELSSIPLTIVDVFHPKRKEYHAYLSNDESKFVSFWRTCNELCRVAFAVLYLILRGLWFPYVALTQVVPDTIRCASMSTTTERPAGGENVVVPASSLYFLAGSSFLFSLLQMYWGVLVAGQVAKALGPKGEEEEGSEKRKRE